jgi:predicted DNA-binding WGR domain protein
MLVTIIVIIVSLIGLFFLYILLIDDTFKTKKKSLILKDGNKKIFFIIKSVGGKLTVNHGVLGTEGKSFTKNFESNQKCHEEFKIKVKEKIKEGYRELPKGEEISKPFSSKKKSNILPIPSHLKKIFIPYGVENDEYRVFGIIRCVCGCECFSINLFAEIENGLPMNSESLVIKIHCYDCKKGYVLFDNNKHGWNGFVCQEGGVTATDKNMIGWKCLKCKHNIYNIKISIRSGGKQDFIAESGIADGDDKFKKSDWVNAFSSIAINIKCNNCSCLEDWDYETQ